MRLISFTQDRWKKVSVFTELSYMYVCTRSEIVAVMTLINKKLKKECKAVMKNSTVAVKFCIRSFGNNHHHVHLPYTSLSKNLSFAC